MQHFQSILIVIGLIAIGGVLIHGYLVSRKEKESVTEKTTNVDIFSEDKSLGSNDESLSEVRIISDQINEEPESENIDFSVALEDDSFEFTSSRKETTFIEDEFKPFDVEPSIDLSSIDESKSSALLMPDSKDEQAVNNVGEKAPELTTTSSEVEEVAQPQDLFIFNVVAKEGKELGGHEILQFFLTSGFRHGEMAIFHRHEHSDGTGPVLFSIANMMAPGVFDTDNMEQFRSEGVSFFLTAPNNEINVKSSFEMMLRAVEQMAEEFDCDVLNADREIMTTAAIY